MPNDKTPELEYIPPSVTGVVLAAPERVTSSLKERQVTLNITEDEMSDLDNDLSFIMAIERSINARVS